MKKYDFRFHLIITALFSFTFLCRGWAGTSGTENHIDTDSVQFARAYDTLSLQYGHEPAYAVYLDSAWFCAAEGRSDQALQILTYFKNMVHSRGGNRSTNTASSHLSTQTQLIPSGSGNAFDRRIGAERTLRWHISSYGSLNTFDELMFQEIIDTTDVDSLNSLFDTLSYRSIFADAKIRCDWKPQKSLLTALSPWVSFSELRISGGAEALLQFSSHIDLKTAFEAESRRVNGRYDTLPAAKGDVRFHADFPWASGLGIITPQCVIAAAGERYLHNTIASVSFMRAEATPALSLDWKKLSLTTTVGWTSGMQDYDFFDGAQQDKYWNRGEFDVNFSTGLWDVNSTVMLSSTRFPFWQLHASNIYPGRSFSLESSLWTTLSFSSIALTSMSINQSWEKHQFNNYPVSFDSIADTIAVSHSVHTFDIQTDLQVQAARFLELTPSLAFEWQTAVV
ncbi:MAG: hypothetical protein JW795_22450, partial [Chitinivibrionales bacterium]|nr:hypothetical protein [Chitinivibrionales bacterium]